MRTITDTSDAKSKDVDLYISLNFSYCFVKNTLCRNGDPVSGYNHSQGYKVISVLNKMYFVHRIIFFITNGIWPKCIDHIDGNRSNNKIENLREVTHRENSTNLKTHRSGKLIGACKVKDKWQSTIKIKGKTIRLGFFKTEQEANNCYLKAFQQLKENKNV